MKFFSHSLSLFIHSISPVTATIGRTNLASLCRVLRLLWDRNYHITHVRPETLVDVSLSSESVMALPASWVQRAHSLDQPGELCLYGWICLAVSSLLSCSHLTKWLRVTLTQLTINWPCQKCSCKHYITDVLNIHLVCCWWWQCCCCWLASSRSPPLCCCCRPMQRHPLVEISLRYTCNATVAIVCWLFTPVNKTGFYLSSWSIRKLCWIMIFLTVCFQLSHNCHDSVWYCHQGCDFDIELNPSRALKYFVWE